MTYPTLDVVADAGGEMSPVARMTETEFADGYKQVVFKGRQTHYHTLSFSYSRTRKHVQPVYDLLLKSLATGEPFFYSFVEGGERDLYVIGKDSLSLSHVSGLRWKVTATFEEWSGLR